MTEAVPRPFKKGVAKPFHFINGDFIVYQDQLETNLLQFFSHPSEWLSIIIFYVNTALEQKQA